MAGSRLGIGFIGAGFVTRFHIQALLGVRDADVAGVTSRTAAHAESACALARSLGVGEARAFSGIADLVTDPAVDAVWICAPNDVRVRVVEEIVAAVRGGARLIGVAVEKPLARTLAEAQHIVRLIHETTLLHGYLENQLFAPSVQRGKEILWRRGAPVAGRPYLARAAEEHSGPHMPWFWEGATQGGGVLNDMLCHSYEAGRHLLTAPDERRDALTVTEVNAQIASLKWSRPEYAAQLRETMGGGLDYLQRPAEDFARATVTHRTPEGLPAIVEATTSWSFVGPGLRLRIELLGPEYSMVVDTLHSDLQVFLSRRISELHLSKGKGEGEGREEDMLEKQNAEQGLMPVVSDEPATYGYVEEDRHMVQSFRAGRMPAESWDDGLAVTAVLMACYLSAERGATVHLDDPALRGFVPAVARGAWRG